MHVNSGRRIPSDTGCILGKCVTMLATHPVQKAESLTIINQSSVMQGSSFRRRSLPRSPIARRMNPAIVNERELSELPVKSK